MTHADIPLCSNEERMNARLSLSSKRIDLQPLFMRFADSIYVIIKRKQMTDRQTHCMLRSLASRWLSLFFALYKRGNVWQTFDILCATISESKCQLNSQKRCWENAFRDLNIASARFIFSIKSYI